MKKKSKIKTDISVNKMGSELSPIEWIKGKPRKVFYFIRTMNTKLYERALITASSASRLASREIIC